MHGSGRNVTGQLVTATRSEALKYSNGASPLPLRERDRERGGHKSRERSEHLNGSGVRVKAFELCGDETSKRNPFRMRERTRGISKRRLRLSAAGPALAGAATRIAGGAGATDR
jgi:hypothetical protein